MKRTILLLLAALTAVPAALAGNFMSGAWPDNSNPQGVRTGARFVREADGYVGPYGTPIQSVAPASYSEPTGADYARAALARSYPQGVLQQTNFAPNPYQQAYPAIQQTGGNAPYACGPQGCPPGPGGPGGPGGLPPGFMINPQFGQGGPSLGLPNGLPSANAALNAAGYGPPGAVAAVGVLNGAGSGGMTGPGSGSSRTQVRFVGPAGMKISWYAPRADGKPGFTSQYLEAPARYNFLQAAIYRLKISDIVGRPGVELYPTLEIVPANAKTATFLAHAAVPVNFTEEDFEQVAAGNFIVKVIYLPDPQFQDLAATGPDEVVSSRLEPGVDPLVEAKRRGSILAVIRLGVIDLEAPNTPSMEAPDPCLALNNAPPANGANGANAAANMANRRPYANMMPQMPQMQPGMNPYAMNPYAMNPYAMRPGMMPPGMMPPGMPPGMMPPGMMPQVPATRPGAPKQPSPVNTDAPKTSPIKTDTPTPVGQAPATGDVQQASATAKDTDKPARPVRTTLLDLMGKPSTSR